MIKFTMQLKTNCFLALALTSFQIKSKNLSTLVYTAGMCGRQPKPAETIPCCTLWHSSGPPESPYNKINMCM